MTAVAADEPEPELDAFSEFAEALYRHRPKRVVVTGGRNYHNSQMVKSVLIHLRQVVVAQQSSRPLVVHGAAAGLDSLVGEYCDRLDIPVAEFPAQWNRYKGRAGPRRNAEMLDVVEPQVVIAFPGGSGTRDCVNAAKRRRIPVLEVPG